LGADRPDDGTKIDQEENLMAKKRSAGLLLYQHSPDRSIKVMCAHMGGPFWANKDNAGWSIPKGEYVEGESPEAVARREFLEELGQELPHGTWLHLGELRQPSGKRITAWAVEGDIDTSHIESNTFELEWPRGSGTIQTFPEIDRAEWFDLSTARRKLVKGQVPFLDVLVDTLRSLGVPASEAVDTRAETAAPSEPALFDPELLAGPQATV
jgi:predicted NUDIX family NTP pyrophosphohydrolase